MSSPRFTWRTAAFIGALALLVASVGVLGRVGLNILRDEETGQVVSSVDDPTQPGFEALVTPTATALLFDFDAGGALAGATMLSLGGGEAGGGTVTLIPATTVLELPFTELGEYPMAEILELTDREGLIQRVEVMFTTAMSEVIDVPVDQWESLLAPLGTLTVDNPSPVTIGSGGVEQRIEAGPVDLAPADVGPFLLAKAESETEPVRLSRVEAFWNAWLAALSERGDPNLVPGETDVGVGRFVRALAAGADHGHAATRGHDRHPGGAGGVQ